MLHKLSAPLVKIAFHPNKHQTLLKRTSALLDTQSLWQFDQQCLLKWLVRVCVMFIFLPVGAEKGGCGICLFRELLHPLVVLRLRIDKLPPSLPLMSLPHFTASNSFHWTRCHRTSLNVMTSKLPNVLL